MEPLILLVNTNPGFGSARLALSWLQMGARVEAVAPAVHPVRKVRGVRRVHRYRGSRPLTSLREALGAARPDLVIPCDDLARTYLNTLRASRHDAEWHELIEKSLGDSAHYEVFTNRTAVIETAKRAGVAVADSVELSSIDALPAAMEQMGLPAVLKSDQTAGGTGVRMVSSVAEAQAAFPRMSAPPSVARIVKRALLDKDTNLVPRFVRQNRSAMHLQRFVKGKIATASAACWRGELLAVVCVEVLETREDRGPAAVVRIIDHPQMKASVAAMVRALGVSGFCGLDFMIEEETGTARLIEMNARAAQMHHLRLGPGRNPVAAVYAALTGNAPRVAEERIALDTVALFPNAWLAPNADEYLQAAWQDVPWEEPALVEFGVRMKQAQNRFSFTYADLARLKASIGGRFRLRHAWNS